MIQKKISLKQVKLYLILTATMLGVTAIGVYLVFRNYASFYGVYPLALLIEGFFSILIWSGVSASKEGVIDDGHPQQSYEPLYFLSDPSFLCEKN